MKREREFAGIAYESCYNRIYVMGGKKVYKSLDTCEYYDINKDKWTSFAQLNEKKQMVSASIINDRFIYLFGGSLGRK